MNRHDRRKANSDKMRGAHIIMRREIFTTSNLGDREIHLDVGAMRAWAEQNVQLESIKICANHVKRLVEGGAISEERIMQHTMKQIPKPILVCEHPEGLGDELVDGNHTYVAVAMAWARGIELGRIKPAVLPNVPGYGLTPAQWQQFVLTPSQLQNPR